MLSQHLKKMALKTGLSSIFLAAAITLPFVMSSASAKSHNDEVALTRATQTQLAYVQTGNATLDQTSEAGLFGLGKKLHKNTNIEDLIITQGGLGIDTNKQATAQIMPVAVDPEKDELAFFPLIYWAIDPNQPSLSEATIDGLNKYMRDGGMLFIDTRDLSTNNRGKTWLQRAVKNGLNIPALTKVKGCGETKKECHVLGKSFFLLDKFPGRYAGGALWAENTDLYRNDGVATVLIGGNDWAAAWAVDENGEASHPVVGNDPKQREFAYRFGINLVTYALTGNYKADQLHIPAIIQRMENKP